MIYACVPMWADAAASAAAAAQRNTINNVMFDSQRPCTHVRQAPLCYDWGHLRVQTTVYMCVYIVHHTCTYVGCVTFLHGGRLQEQTTVYACIVHVCIMHYMCRYSVIVDSFDY